MHVEVTGRGPPLVLLHGWAMHAGIFAPLVRQLRAHCTLHLVDLPGHGLSPPGAQPFTLPAVAAELADALPRAVWLGWSLGGLLALELARTRPQQVRALVLLCSAPRFIRSPDWPDGMDPALVDSLATDLAANYRGTLDRFLALEAVGSDHAREELRMLRTHVYERGRPAPAVLSQGLAVLRDTDLRAALPQLAAPSLWIAGQRDRLVHWRAVQAAAATAPDAGYARVAGAGHAPFLGHAEAVATRVHGFMEACPS
jgi:pimeloyl-[acyl-carrier protein] methyl ester esterase